MSLSITQVVGCAGAEHGGPSRSVPSMSEALVQEGHEVSLVTSARVEDPPLLEKTSFPSYVMRRNSWEARRPWNPFAFRRNVRKNIKEQSPELIHDHGAWWFATNWVAARAACTHDIPLIVSPRGMLRPRALEFNSWKKTLAWHLYQRQILQQVTLFHATSEDEAESLRDLGLRQPIALLPNGVAPPDQSLGRVASSQKRVLFLSRLHPIKGVPTLLRSWAHVCPSHWTLELVGPTEEGHRAKLETQVQSLGIEDTVAFTGPVEEDEKWEKYASADLFVLPSHSENFGIVVAEALAAGLPVITTTGTPWQDLEEYDCGWWIELETDRLAEVLREAMSLTVEKRRAMGERGRELVEKRYTWSSIAERMAQVYGWILGEDAQPECIQTP